MIINFDHPEMQMVWVPLVVGLAAVGLIRFLLGPARGALLASMGIGLGYLAAHLLMQGLPDWPPAGALDTLPYVLLGGIALGAVFDELDNPEGLLKPLFIGFPIVIVFWLGLAFFGGFKSLAASAPFAVIMIGGIVAMQRMHDDRDDGTASPMALFMAVVGLAVVGNFGESKMFGYAIALAFAGFSFLVWNWPRTRFPWGTTGTLSIGGTYVTLAGVTVLNNAGLVWPIAITFLVFFVAPLVEKMFYPRQSAQPFLQLFISLGPVIAAGFMAYWLA